MGFWLLTKLKPANISQTLTPSQFTFTGLYNKIKILKQNKHQHVDNNLGTKGVELLYPFLSDKSVPL